jgi:hypothetical protein
MLRVPNRDDDVNRTRRHRLSKNSPLVASVSIFICLALVLGCKGNAVVSNSQQSADPNASSGLSSAMNYSRFKQRLDAGASCAELLEIRNSLDPKATVVVRMNEELREVGCYSSESVRSSTVSTAEKAKSEDVQKESRTITFTVNEYRMYRAVINAPSSVPEQQALQNVATQYKIPVEDVRKVVNKVQKSLFDNKWFGTPESEIQRATDWKGETH